MRRIVAGVAAIGIIIGAAGFAQSQVEPAVQHVSVQAGEGLWQVSARLCPNAVGAQFGALQRANPWYTVGLHPGTVLHNPEGSCPAIPSTSTSTSSSPTSTSTSTPDASTTTSSISTSSTLPPSACPGQPNEPGGEDPFGGCWPGPDNTGVPAGLTLTPHVGSCTLTSGTYDARLFNCGINIDGPVTITNSSIVGTVRVRGAGRLTITDSNIHASFNQSGFLTSNSGGLYGRRLEITGGNRSGFCDPCDLRDSFVHGQETELPAHASGVRASQNATLVHNTLWCEPQNCSANLTGYPDFEPTTNWLLQSNLFMSGPGPTFCAFGGNTAGKPYSDDVSNATDIRFVDNVFKRDLQPQCGALGSIVAFSSTNAGNVWQGNVWADTGTPVPPRD